MDIVRENFLSQVAPQDLVNLRLVCHDWSHRIASKVFRDFQITFKASTFTRPSRVAALDRIGPYVKSLRFKLPRTEETFLPPLIDPHTGEETSFVYNPQVQLTPSNGRDLTRNAKYGSQEVADLLVKQYPPLFHASTNVPAFIRALDAMTNVCHIEISSSIHDARNENRRSTVDFALISLRIAIERAPLSQLEALSFRPIHPLGLFYMQPVLGIGASPKSLKRWAQIKRMAIEMESYTPDRATRSGQLKTLHSYLRGFANFLTQFHFRWRGNKGPSPISLDSEPCVCSGLTNEPTSARRNGQRSDQDSRRDPTPDPQGLTALKFTALNRMELENAVMDATQISAFICSHKRTLEEFKFESIRLRSGNWDEALQPLAADIKRSQLRRRKKNKMLSTASMDVPIMLSQVNTSQIVLGEIGGETATKARVADAPEVTPKGSTERDRGASSNLCRWLSKRTAARAKEKAKAHCLFRNTLLPWKS